MCYSDGMLRLLLRTATVAALVMTSVSLQAAEAEGACEDVLVAMESGVDRAQAIDRLTLTMADEFTRVPEIATMEQQHPGLTMQMAKAMRPVLATFSNRIQAEYRPRMVAACSEVFSPSEARDVAAFYRSPIGRKLLSSVSANMDGRNTIADALKSKSEDISAKSVQADLDNLSRQAVASLSREELYAIGRMSMEKPALQKLPQFRTRVTPLQVEMENAPMNDQEEAALQRALLPLLKRFSDKAEK